MEAYAKFEVVCDGCGKRQVISARVNYLNYRRFRIEEGSEVLIGASWEGFDHALRSQGWKDYFLGGYNWYCPGCALKEIPEDEL